MGFKAGVLLPIYVSRVLLYVVVGLWIATATSALPAFWHIDEWWNQPIVYQKLVIWTMLLGAVGVIGDPGSARGHAFVLLRRDATRLPPWPDAIPGSGGDKRTFFDAVLYVGFLGTSALALIREGVDVGGIGVVLPHNASGLIDPPLLVAPLVLLLLCGLRDKTIFVVTRAQQYAPALVAFYLAGHLGRHGFVDSIVMLKLLVATAWITAWLPSDLRSPRLDHSKVRVTGAVLEMGLAFVLLLNRDRTVTIVAICVLVGLHALLNFLHSSSVSLEWNVLLGYAAIFLFLGFPNSRGYGLGDVSSWGLLVATIGCLAFFSALRALRPHPEGPRQLPVGA